MRLKEILGEEISMVLICLLGTAALVMMLSALVALLMFLIGHTPILD